MGATRQSLHTHTHTPQQPQKPLDTPDADERQAEAFARDVEDERRVLERRDERAAAACSRWNFPPLGGVGLAAMAAFLSLRAFCIGVSIGESSCESAMVFVLRCRLVLPLVAGRVREIIAASARRV